MLSLRILPAFVLFLASLCTFVVANDFAGANSYFLFAVNDDDRHAILDAMQSANMKVLRVFIRSSYANTKGSSAVYVDDLELKAVGKYDDTILAKIDNLAKEATERGMKLLIALHDRFSLGIWDSDAYVDKYNLKSNPEAFYTNSKAVQDFDNRLTHILNYKSPNFGKAWKDLSEAIFAFDIQNEAMADISVDASDWWCGRAKTMRSVMGNSKVQISTGGGPDISSSLRAEFFSCPQIDIVAVHTYDLDPSNLADNLDHGKNLASQSGQRILVEEFGAKGSNKDSEIKQATSTLISTGLPWMYWELVIPGQSSANYEVWTDEPSWATLKSAAQNTVEQGGMYGWSEIDTN